MPTVTKNLIIINVLLFLAQFVAQSYGINLSDYLGLHFFLADNFNPAQLFTYMFMHAHLSVSGHKVLITKQTELGYRPFAPLDNAGGVFLCERRNKLCAAYLLYL